MVVDFIISHLMVDQYATVKIGERLPVMSTAVLTAYLYQPMPLSGATK